LEEEKVTNLCQTPSAFQVLSQVDEEIAKSQNRELSDVLLSFKKDIR